MYRTNQQFEKKFSKNWTLSYSDFSSTFSSTELQKIAVTLNQSWRFEKNIRKAYNNYQLAKTVQLRYDVEFSEGLCWFSNTTFFVNSELYEYEPQIRHYIEERDWYNADLLSYRITDNIETVLKGKNMPKIIDGT